MQNRSGFLHQHILIVKHVHKLQMSMADGIHTALQEAFSKSFPVKTETIH